MKIIKEPISIQDLKKISEATFKDLVKVVVDVENEIMAVGGELHSDEEALLIEQGAKQQSLWGINLYPDLETEDWIEFDSVINIRPAQDNFSRGVDNPQIRKKINEIVNKLIKR
jgi:hypothetical protein